MHDEQGQITAEGEAQVEIREDSLTVLPKFGEALYFSLRDIIDATQQDYKITLTLSSKETLIFSDIGYQYEDLLRQLLKERNVMVVKDSLVTENPIKSFDNIDFVYNNEKGKIEDTGELKVYRDKVIIIPKQAELIKLYFASVNNISDRDYSLELTSEYGTTLVLVKLGERHGDMVKLFSQLMSNLSLNIQSTLQELFPSINPLIIRKASRLLKEGRATKKKDIVNISADLWQAMEMKLFDLGIKEEYDYLSAKADKDRVSIGLKKERGGEFVWFLIPISNTIVMEATSQTSSGKATYFFRVVDSQQDKDHGTDLKISNIIDRTLYQINDAMIKTEFKREPIYLTDEQLQKTEYQQYKFALEKLPELKTLRELFLGRVIHNSPEQWRADVDALLKSNN